MGAIEKSNAIYLTIADGQISRRVQKPTDKSIQRTTKLGKVVHEEFYKGWKGKITDIRVKDHPEYGKFWNVTLNDQDGDAIIQMNYSSGYASSFLKTLPNVDFSSDVIITPNMKMEGEKKKTTVFISQHGKALKHAYTKEDPNGLPQLKQIKVKGKVTWDDSDLMEFLENMVKEEILPQLKETKVSAADITEPIPDDQMPF